MNFTIQDMSAHQRGQPIPESLIARVRESTNIVQVIGEHVKLRRAGTDFRGPCPFHGGKNPNFSVSPSEGFYHCFKCQESGNVFTFLQKQFGMSFPDAVRSVAAMVGIVTDSTPVARRPMQQPPPMPTPPRSRLDHLDQGACAWAGNGQGLNARIIYDALLDQLPLSDQGRAYLAARNLCPDVAYRSGVRSIDDWRVFTSDFIALGNEWGFEVWDMYAAGFIPPGTYRIPNAQPLTVSQWLSPRYACDAVPTLLFVYRDVDGVTAGLRFRALIPHEHKSLSTRRVNGLTEALAVPFGAELLADCGGRVVHIAEGEPDSLALRGIGTLTIGLPGTVIPGHRLDHTAPWMLALRTARAVCIWTDHDDAGVRLAHRLTDELRALDVQHIRRVRWPKRTEKDANDLLRTGVLADTVVALEEAL